MSIMQWKPQAKQAIKNGFKIIPLRHGDKRPLRAGKWEEQLLSNEDIDKLPSCGFGLVCGVGEQPIYAFDVDSKDKKIADTFKDAFELHHGNPIVRIGQKPKILIPFRMAKAGIKKKKSPESHQGHLDILGGGQYFVAYNIHPKTKEEYTWTTPPDAFKAEELPLLSEDNVEYFFDFFQSLTTPKVKAKKKEVQLAKQWQNDRNRRYTNREITAFLSCFGESFYNGSHDDWIPVVMAVHHETRGSDKGKELARRWSEQGSTYDEDNFNYKWGTFVLPEEMGEHKKKCSSFASLFYHHRKLIPDGLLCDRFSDAYNRALFALCNHGNFFYVESFGGWFVRKKHLWELCSGSNELMLSRVHRFLIGCRESGKDLEDWSEEEKIQAREIAKATGMPLKKSPRDKFYASFKVEKVEGTAKAKSSLNLLEASGLFRIEANKVDSNTRYIADTDGILDLETGQQITPKEELYITKSTGTPFVTGKPSQEFMDLVSSYFENEEVMYFFLRCVGMALLGGNEAHKIVNLLGIGRSGKSTLIKLLEYAFGDQYIAHLQFKDITSVYESDAGTPSPSIVNAFGSRIAVVNETNEYAPLNEAVVKAITGGDTIASRLLYSNNIIRKKAGFTPFIITNKALFIRSTDDSIWERLTIIPFKKRVKTIDPTLEGRLTGYALDAKRWFLQGVQDYIGRGHQLDIPEVCVRAVEEERYELDTVQRWIDDYCDIGDDFFEKYSVLIDSYNDYLREVEKSRVSVKLMTFIKNLTQKGFIKDRVNEGKGSNRRRIRGIKGLKLKPVFEAIDDKPNNVIDFRKD